MSTLKEALYKWLTSNPAVQALVHGRVYHTVAPQGAEFPRITMFQLFENQIESADGSAGLCKSTMQISSWGFDPLQVDSVVEAVRQSLQGYKGTIDGIEIQGIKCENALPNYEKPDDDSSDIIFVVHAQYSIWYRVSVPVFIQE